MAASSKAWVCGCLFRGTASSNPVGGMDVVCGQVSAAGRSLVHSSPTECVCVCH